MLTLPVAFLKLYFTSTSGEVWVNKWTPKTHNWFIVASFSWKVWTVLFKVSVFWFINDDIYGDSLASLLIIRKEP